MTASNHMYCTACDISGTMETKQQYKPVCFSFRSEMSAYGLCIFLD